MENFKVFMHKRDVEYKEHEMDTLKRYLTMEGWSFVDDPEDADILFFGSGYAPAEYLDNDKIKVCFFWGYPFFRMVDCDYRKELIEKINNTGKCDLILTPSVSVAYQALDFGLNPVCVYWGADRKFIELQPNHEMENQIVCINRITYHKRQDLLIDAVAKSKTKPKLVIIGDGDPEFKQIIISKAKNLGVDLEIKKLNFETYAEDKIAEIKKSKALISTSYYEGFGISPAEAIMCNRIPLLNDIPVFREIYKDDAKYFHNVDELAETIDWIMTIMDRDYIVPENSKERLDIDRVANTINLIMGDYIKQSLGKKVRENIDDRKVYSSAYDIEHIRDYQFSSHRYNPDWERHWRVPYARESLIGKKVLDIGCSYGAYTIHFVRNGFDVTAADCSPVALHQCKENLLKYGFEDKVRLVETFSDKMPFSDGEFDSIWAGEIVEHIPEHLLDASMREFIRVVRKGGRLVFSVPIGTHHNDPLHLRIFDDNSIKALFENYADLINIVKIEKIGEGDLDKSCYFIVADKK